MKIFNRDHLQSRDGILYIEIPPVSQLGWVTHGFLTRQGGKSLPPYDSLNVSMSNGDDPHRVSSNRERIAKVFGFDKHRLVLLRQMQRDGIFILKNPEEVHTIPLKYDAILTDLPNQILGIQTADCIPMIMIDQKKKVVGAVHAGRQGTALHIAKKTLRKMKEELGCSEENLLVILGPSIGPCCYEVDEKVFIEEWKPFAKKRGKGKWMLDLSGINVAQLMEEGIRTHQIYRVDLCTRCHSDLFFSYRREGKTGRQLSFIGMV